MAKGRVFVAQQPVPNGKGWTPNLESATLYGPLEFIFDGSDRPQYDTTWAMSRAIEVLRDFSPTEDYLLWPSIGDPVGWAVIMALVGFKRPATFRILKWERKMTNGQRTSEGFYIPITIRLPHLKKQKGTTHETSSSKTA